MVKTQNSQLNKALAYLIAAFPDCPEFTDLNYEVYYDVLSDYEYEQILDGFRRFVKESGSKFFPSAPQVVQWVDPKSEVDAVFDAAYESQVEHIFRREKLIAAFLEKKIQEGEWFVRVRMSDTAYRDSWEWLGEEERKAGRYRNCQQLSAETLKERLSQPFKIGMATKTALMNSVRAWFLTEHEAAKLEGGGDAG